MVTKSKDAGAKKIGKVKVGKLKLNKETVKDLTTEEKKQIKGKLAAGANADARATGSGNINCTWPAS